MRTDADEVKSYTTGFAGGISRLHKTAKLIKALTQLKAIGLFHWPVHVIPVVILLMIT